MLVQLLFGCVFGQLARLNKQLVCLSAAADVRFVHGGAVLDRKGNTLLGAGERVPARIPEPDRLPHQMPWLYPKNLRAAPERAG
jgi:hypothetical protein